MKESGKDSIIRDKDIPITLTAAIFSLKDYKFMTEMNGLLYKENITLYAVIENIFIKIIPMFAKLYPGYDIDKQDKLSVIVKIQDYQFQREDEVIGGWHSEGHPEDDIIAVGLYYFDVKDNKKLKFHKNYLEITDEEIFIWKSSEIEGFQ